MAKRPARKWSAGVTRRSDALDLEEDIFKSNDPDRIARSLKHSAETSRRRKSSAYRSAISMLTFYMNRAGKNLSGRRRRIGAGKDQPAEGFPSQGGVLVAALRPHHCVLQAIPGVSKVTRHLARPHAERASDDRREVASPLQTRVNESEVISAT